MIAGAVSISGSRMNETEASPGAVKTKLRKFSCNLCSRAFTKSEHLARHQRSHLKHKPFTCPRCHKSFGRQDVLSRHAKQLHGLTVSPDNESGQIPLLAQPDQTGVERPSVLEASAASRHGTPSLVDTMSPNVTEPSPHVNMEVDLEPSIPWNGEDMLELLMSDFGSNWPVTLPVMPIESCITGPPPLPVDNQSAEAATSPGYQAMQQMSRLISDLSFNIRAEIESTGITSAFLDTCIHVFFDKFIPSFPVLHKQTFSPRESSNPLLLNIFALGSLFIGAKDAIRKGEALWRLSHTAVATSWQALLAVRGPRDECNGVQLVLTALLGQIYAMLSRNESLRMTSQIFHGLGFCWARQCGMYNIRHLIDDEIPLLDADDNEKLEKWKVWVAREVQNRAVLGHYILDGQISQYSGYPASARHVTNPLLVPESDAAFAASSPDAWIMEMQKQRSPRQSLREVFCQIFSRTQPRLERPLSNFSVRLVLEGLQSLASDLQETEGPAVGTPSNQAVIQALVHLYNSHFPACTSSPGDDMKLIIRWHSICLNIATPIPVLCRNLCTYYGIRQHLYHESGPSALDFNLREWSQSSDGLRALLHAISIQDIMEKMPLGMSHAINLPAAIFSVATIYSARCLTSLPTVIVPNQVRWENVWTLEISDVGISESVTSLDPVVQKYLLGNLNKEEKNTSTRNLLYDLNSIELMLGSISSRWGISKEMDEIIHQWMTIANQVDRSNTSSL